MNTWFTSDTHFGHANIIKYSSRPFKTAEEMDNTIIHNWNAVVQPGDTVYHLGDFAVGGGGAVPYFKRLHGNILFCWGNHDKRLRELETGKMLYGPIEHVRHISVDGQRIFLSHYAHRVWDGSHRGVWHLYGHSHGTLPDDPASLSFDVGLDCTSMMPLSLRQVAERMAKKSYKPVDHHGAH